MYALLGDASLDDKRLRSILRSVFENDNSKGRLDAFRKVATRCVQRRRDLLAWWKCRQSVTSSSLLTLQQDDVKNDIRYSMDVASTVEAQAKGALLARRIRDNLCSLKPPQAKRDTTVGGDDDKDDDDDDDDNGWGCIILWAAYFLEDEGDNATGSGHHAVFWDIVRQHARSEAVWEMPERAMAMLCGRDAGVFDGYLSKLLTTISGGGERAAESGRRVRALTKCNG